jgi:hypothetical protein
MCVNGGDGNFKLMLILEKASVFPETVLKIMAFICELGVKFKFSASSYLILRPRYACALQSLRDQK